MEENKNENKNVEKKDFKKPFTKKPFNKKPVKTLDEIVLDTKAVVKVTKGGRQRRFQAVVYLEIKKVLLDLEQAKQMKLLKLLKKQDKMQIKM